MLRLVPFAIVFLLSPCLHGEDWTQWSGNDRRGTWAEDGILRTIPDGGLKTSWTVPIGSGYSGPVVSKGRVIVTDYRPIPETRTLEAKERVLCLDEKTGKELWKYEWETHYRRQMASYATGPRATPLIAGDRVITIGATGVICCLDLESGKLHWTIDSLKQFGAGVPVFGVSATGIVWEDTVIIPCGGREGLLRALHLKTGKEIWKALPASHDLPYTSPELFELHGAPRLIQWCNEKLAAFDPSTGRKLWSVPFTARANMAIGRPVQIGNHILVSGFYDGSMLVRVTGAESAEIIWKNGGKGERPNQTKSLHAVITTPIVEGDHFYGTCSYGELRGLNLKDGERVWENKDLTRQGRWGSFFWVKNGDHYFVNNDLGELLIMQFTPDGPKVFGRTQLIEPDTECGYGPRRFANAKVNWVHPAYANRHVIIRNDHEIKRISLAAD